jgi:hypothetical protein
MVFQVVGRFSASGPRPFISEGWAKNPLAVGQPIAERRRRGLSIKRAAGEVGVDEGTWLRWERRDWKSMRLTTPAIDRFLVLSSKDRFPDQVR